MLTYSGEEKFKPAAPTTTFCCLPNHTRNQTNTQSNLQGNDRLTAKYK